MTSRELISVIVPICNVAPFLKTCLDSALDQSYPNTEVIVIDDGSTDDSKRIIREYAAKDARVRAVFHEENRGAWAARNSGLQVASGSYISFLDGDDRWEPEFLETMAAELHRLPDSFDAVFCWSRIIDRDGKITGKRVEPSPGAYALEDMMVGICPPRSGSALMLRKRCFDQGGFAPMSGHDSEMWLRILSRSPDSRFQCLPAPLVQYRVRPGSLSSHSPVRRLESLQYRIDRYLDQIPETRRWEFYVSVTNYALTLGHPSVAPDVKTWSRAALRGKSSLMFKKTGWKMLLIALFGYHPYRLRSFLRKMRAAR